MHSHSKVTWRCGTKRASRIVLWAINHVTPYNLGYTILISVSVEGFQCLISASPKARVQTVPFPESRQIQPENDEPGQ